MEYFTILVLDRTYEVSAEEVNAEAKPLLQSDDDGSVVESDEDDIMEIYSDSDDE